MGVILSGLLWDGVEGLSAIHQAGGKCLVQSPADAIFQDMPLHAIDAVDIDFVGTADEIAQRLIEIARPRSCE